MVGTVGGSTSVAAVDGLVRSAAAAPPRPGTGPAELPEDGAPVTLSATGRAAAAAESGRASAEPEEGSIRRLESPATLSPAELKQIDQLKARDREVRAHELAHQAAAGGLASGGASFTYQRGPDGVNYAVGGEVPITLREGRTPEETIANAQTIRAAALAPADPSAQDRAVAAQAARLEAQARSELAQPATSEGEPARSTTGGADAAAAAVPGFVAVPEPAPNGAAEPGSEPGAAAVERHRAGLSEFYRSVSDNRGSFAALA